MSFLRRIFSSFSGNSSASRGSTGTRSSGRGGMKGRLMSAVKGFFRGGGRSRSY